MALPTTRSIAESFYWNPARGCSPIRRAYDRAILQIDGDAEEVVAATLHNLRIGSAPAIDRKELPGGGTILEVSYGPEGARRALLTTDRPQNFIDIYNTNDFVFGSFRSPLRQAGALGLRGCVLCVGNARRGFGGKNP